MENKNDKERFYKNIVNFLIVLFFIICCFLIFYSHIVIKTDRVFTHFFYIPIILSIIYWKRKGLILSFALIGVLFSSYFFDDYSLIQYDILRAVNVIAVSLLVLTLIERIEKSEEKLRDARVISYAIKSVNQFICFSKEKEQILKEVCGTLVGTCRYESIWIALINESWELEHIAQKGLGNDFYLLKENLEKGEFSKCLRKAMLKTEIISIKDPLKLCDDFPLRQSYFNKEIFIIRLEHNKKVYGLMAVSLKKDPLRNKKEERLFYELARGISLALYNIELEEKKDESQKILEENHRKLLQIIQGISIPTFVLNKNHKVINWNKACEALTGIYAKDIVGTQNQWVAYYREKRPVLADLVLDHSSEKEIEKYYGRDFKKSKLLENGYEAEGYFPYLGKEGKWLFFTAVPIKNENGEITGAIETLQDITERKKTEESLRVMSRAVGSSINAIVFSDFNWNINYTNRSFIEMWGYDNKEDILGFNLLNFCISKKDFKDILKNLNDKGGWIGEMKGKRKDGSEFDIEASLSVVNNKKGDPICIMNSFVDISERKRLDMAKTEFVSMASHQLRTPLTAINGYSEMLLDGDAGDLNEEQKEYVEELYSSNKRLIDLVNDLLNVSRVDLGTYAIRPEKIEIKEIAEETLKDLSAKIKEKSLKIAKNYQEIPLVELDRKIIRMIFENLLSNSVKYSSEGGNVILSIKSDEKDIIISVFDNGCGIPKKDQPKIFTKLFRADNIRETEGTGLGLYIIKSILSQTEGKIWFESEEGKGSKFYVRIPLKGMKKNKQIKGLG